MNHNSLNQSIDALTGLPFGKSVEWKNTDNTCVFRYPVEPFIAEYQQQMNALLQTEANIQHTVRAHKTGKDIEPIQGVKNIIAVASGKGGVGKSTTTVMLAYELQQLGAKVGILDADIYGPSIPTMLGTDQQPESPDQKSFLPIEANGIQAMSLGFLLDQKAPAIWRGAMVTKALMQMLQDTRWKDLDYLLIDLPPGTGDIQLTMIQKIPLTAAVIVTTPQKISLIDAQKALAMFKKVEIPVLGIIENMSSFICGNCGHESHVFGNGGGESMAQEFDVTLLGQLPLHIEILQNMDTGTAQQLWHQDHPLNTIAQKITLKMAQQLAQLPLALNVSGNSLKLHL